MQSKEYLTIEEISKRAKFNLDSITPISSHKSIWTASLIVLLFYIGIIISLIEVPWVQTVSW